ncbi:RRM_1 domain-containing protein [Cephalotus follicularis]|uniref:RRM_1 domain-containing protein n=1 Tax=Cephalotus follicularis TaxID=3775 RepID=A0A1Q3BZ17_CEPFO|nr:RRM_1 domain-containing protein [Cephalotus follicularis]
MSQQRHNKMVSDQKICTEFGDKTYTKIFVGGLAWETRRETLKDYFEQFGEILEAVVINDKSTGRSKGYGFVTFKDANSAMRACQNPYPVIDGRRANCNLASHGAQKTHGIEKLRPPPPPPRARAPTTFLRQPIPQYAFPYSAFGYSAYPQDRDAMSYYYNVYGRQQFPSGYPALYLNYYPYSQDGRNSPNQYPNMIQQPYLHQQYRAFGFLAVPTSVSPSLAAVTGPATSTDASAVGVLGTASELQPVVISTTKATQSAISLPQ